jgi:hypothetical protein
MRVDTGFGSDPIKVGAVAAVPSTFKAATGLFEPLQDDKDPQGAKPKGEVIGDILGSLKDCRP